MEDDAPRYSDPMTEIVVKIAVGAVLTVLGLLVVIALLSFIQERGGSLDDLPAATIKEAVDAVTGEES